MKKTIVLLTLLLCARPAFAQEAHGGGATGLDRIEIEGLFYLTYTNGEVGGKDQNLFSINRAYLTTRVQVLPKLQGRITMDTHQDMESDGRGDWKVRLKYAYAKYNFGDYGQIRGFGVEGGMVHMVWLDFEEHVDLYRMRDPMFMERSGMFNSADLGITFTGGLGESLDEEYRSRVTSHYADRYGSFAFGVYNGAGYHGVEDNTDKNVQGRLTLRPLPDQLPGLQFSGLAILGKGNKEGDRDELPNWRTYNLFTSYQYEHGTLTAQYTWGEGNQNGSWTEPLAPTEATNFTGYSFFGEGKFGSGWRLIGGYDRLDRTPGTTDLSFNRVHAGFGYDLGSQNVLLLDWDRREFDDASLPVDTRYRVVMQLKF
ncbi:MAG: hypothetical protein KAJ42_09120 [Gemmatimonadetes bacterium]|nr:hypothetical protein [Gemmatimonadota bacterium]